MSKNTTNNNFFFINDGKDDENGCLWAGLIALLTFCVPGLWMAVFVNWIVPINMFGVVLTVIIGTALTLFLFGYVGFVSRWSALSTMVMYGLLCVVFGIPLLTEGYAGRLFEEATGKKPYTSLITNEYGQIAFWVGVMCVIFVGILLWMYKVKFKTQGSKDN